MLTTGREREFWECWSKAATWNPNASAGEAVSEWIARLSAPGGLRGCLETYRAGLKNARINDELIKTKLTMPVMTLGAPEFFGELVRDQMERVAERVVRSDVFEECGHSLALEAPDRLASALLDFIRENG